MKSISPHLLPNRPAIIGMVVFFLLMLLTQAVSYQRYLLYENSRKAELNTVANTAKEKLQTTLSNCLTATKTLSFMVAQYQAEQNFDRVAKSIIESNKYIDALELIKGGVITNVYPLNENKMVLGFNIMTDSAQKETALHTAIQSDIFFEGPLQLKQGYTGIIGRLPIKIDDKFWGFAAVVIKLSTLVKAAGMDNADNREYTFQFAKINTSTNETEFLLPQNNRFNLNAAVAVPVPEGNWKIFVSASESHFHITGIPFVILGFLLSFTGGAFAWFITKQPYQLKKQVEEKTLSFFNEKKLSESIINSLPGIFCFSDEAGKFLRWNKNFETISRYSTEEIAHMHPLDFFNAENKTLVKSKIKQLLSAGIVEMETEFTTKDGRDIPFYFTGHLTEFEGENYLIGMGIDVTKRKEAEQELLHEKNLSESIVNSLPGVFYIADSSGNMLRWNKNCEYISEYSSEEIGKMQTTDFADSETKKAILAARHQVLTTGKVEVEHTLRTKSGGKFTHFFTIMSIHYNGRQCVMGMGMDISERKKSELQIRERVKELNGLYQVSEIANQTGVTIEHLLQQCLEIIPPVYLHPEITQVRIQYENQIWETKNFIETQWKQQAVLQINERQVGAVVVCYTENLFGTTDDPFLQEKRTFIDSVAGIISNSIERKNVEAAIRISEEKYRHLFHNNPSIILIWDLETLAILEVNDRANELYGYTRQELIGMSMAKLRPVEDRQLIIDFAQTMLLSDQDKVRRTWRHQKKNGQNMYMDITSHKLVYNGKRAILSLAKDITDQHIAETELVKSYENIRRLNAHLQTIREEERAFIAREIHDELGQQLTALKMDISWFSKKIAPTDKPLQDKAKEMVALVDETVKTVRRISSDLRPGILDDLGLVAALEWQSTEFEKRSGITSKFNSGLAEMDCNRGLATGIFRVFQESLTNVMRHSKATLVESTLTKANGKIQLQISDNGTGFDINAQKTKKTLGLLGMQERASMFGGELTILSQPDKGTTIILQVPV